METKRKQGNGYEILNNALNSIKNRIAKAGWVERKGYPESDMTTAQVAEISEYGMPSKNIPPRPVVRPAIIKNESKWRKIAAIETKKVFKGEQTGLGVMEVVGLAAAGDIRENITQLRTPALSPVTIYNRLHRKANKKTVGALDKPLIDTEHYINTLTNTVETL